MNYLEKYVDSHKHTIITMLLMKKKIKLKKHVKFSNKRRVGRSNGKES